MCHARGTKKTICVPNEGLEFLPVPLKFSLVIASDKLVFVAEAGLKHINISLNNCGNLNRDYVKKIPSS